MPSRVNMSHASVHSTDYFINKSDNAHDGDPRYWEPHSASIDFCETNYLLSDYIAEPHNAWSSIWGLSVFGAVGMLRGNPTGERRIFLTYLVLFAIGIGSASLHATLHWTFQSSDELPMIYLVVCAAFCCLEVDSPRGRPQYPRLPLCLVALCCANTAIYFVFQEIYIIFLSTFIALLLMVVSLHTRIAWRHKQKRGRGGGAAPDGCSRGGSPRRSDSNSEIALRFYLWHYVAFAVVATPVWFLDQFRCAELLPTYNALPFPFRGMTLHALWHACSGLGAHLFVQFLVVCRADALGMACDVELALGVLPVAILEETAAETTEVIADAKKQR